MNILVIDVGTSSMRGILLTHEGEELAISQVLYQVTYMENGWVEQDASDWENALYRILKDVSAQAKEKGVSVDAVAVTSQRSSVIPVDRSIRPVSRAIMWQDKRTSVIGDRLAEENDRVFALCGARVNPVFSGGKMTWIRENQPDIYEKTYKFLVIPDYLIYKMTGRLCTDYTYGSRSNLMNIRTCSWDDELLRLFQVEKDKLNELVEPGSVCGTITKEMAELTGCPEGIPVITAGGDQQCGAIGNGVVNVGKLSVTAGTGGFLITAADEVPADLKPNVICNCFSIKGQYVLESSVLACCSAFDWFRREFYGDCSYDKLNEEIEKSPIGANGCICVPYFQGRSTPDWNSRAKGVFANITLNTGRHDMLRSLLEGICYEIGNGVRAMEEYVPLSDIYINGGLTNSDSFNNIQCNVYGTRLLRRGKTDATARGALMVAAAALGAYASVEEAFTVIGNRDEVKEYLPKKEIMQQYEKCREEMNDLYRKIYSM